MPIGTKKYPLLAGFIVVSVVVVLGAVFYLKTHPCLTGSHSKKIALLPLINTTKAHADDYLGQGFSAELAKSLGSYEGLEVLSREAVSGYVDANVPRESLPSVTLIEGQIQRTGNILKFSIRLVDSKTGKTFWEADTQADEGSVYEAQRKLAERTAGLFGRSLAVGSQKNVAHVPDPSALLLYMQGRYFLPRRTRENLEKARGFYLQATQKDPQFNDANAALATTYGLMAYYGYMPANEAYQLGEKYAQAALRYNAHSLEALLFMAFKNHVVNYDREKSKALFQEALALYPSDPTAWYWYGDFLTAIGDFSEAEKAASKALEIAPHSATVIVGSAKTFYYAGKFDETIERCKKVIKSEPGNSFAYYWLGMSLLQKGDRQSSVAVLNKGFAQAPEMSMLKAALATAEATSGDNKEARRLLKEMEMEKNENAVPAYLLSMVYTALGDTKQALALLHTANQRHEGQTVFVSVEPAFKALRGKTEFIQLVKEMHL